MMPAPMIAIDSGLAIPPAQPLLLTVLRRIFFTRQAGPKTCLAAPCGAPRFDAIASRKAARPAAACAPQPHRESYALRQGNETELTHALPPQCHAQSGGFLGWPCATLPQPHCAEPADSSTVGPRAASQPVDQDAACPPPWLRLNMMHGAGRERCGGRVFRRQPFRNDLSPLRKTIPCRRPPARISSTPRAEKGVLLGLGLVVEQMARRKVRTPPRLAAEIRPRLPTRSAPNDDPACAIVSGDEIESLRGLPTMRESGHPPAHAA